MNWLLGVNWLYILLGLVVLAVLFAPDIIEWLQRHVRHVHRYDIPVRPDGGPAGAAQLAYMAGTGRVPYRCRWCPKVRLR